MLSSRRLSYFININRKHENAHQLLPSYQACASMASGAAEAKTNCIAKAGLITGGFYPLKSKKVYNAVLKDRVLEIYKSTNHEKSGKEPKFLFDLSIAFDIHLHYECTLKECISVMLPDETFFLKPLSDADDLEDWFSQLIDKTRQARATRLGRPVFREEYFEIAWDVEMVKLPKLRKKSKGVDNMEDVVSKYSEQLLGKRRMCMYPHSVIIARRGLTASANGFPPLHPDEFMEFPMNAVSNFGKQEKYFFLRVGRFAPTGAGELWLCTESGDCAASIYEKVSKICERESEKRRSQGGRLPSHTSSRRSGLHRDRAHTQSHRPQTDTSALSSAFDNSRKTSAVSISSMFPTSSPPATNLSARSSSFCIAGHASATRGAAPNVARQPIKEESAKTSPSELPKLPAPDGSGVVKFVANRNNSDELFGDDPDESSGGTIMYIGDQDAAGRCGDETPRSSQPAEKSTDESTAEIGDYTVFNNVPIPTYLHERLLSIGARPPSGIKQTSLQSTKDSSEAAIGEYTQMECAADSAHLPLPTSDQNFNLTEVHSYVSDSTESCHSGAFSNRSNPPNETGADSQRAYSLGSKPQSHATLPLSTSRHVHNNVSNDVIDETNTKQYDDPRKRAHSLGSKSWMKPLRKTTNVRTGSECSESGSIRQRSDSFGSSNGVASGSRAASFSTHRDVRKGARLASNNQHDHTDDLTEWDFGVCRSGSSSIASIESPCNSRTSSFGVSGATLLRTALDEVKKSQKGSERSRAEFGVHEQKGDRIENSCKADGDNEYVLSSYGPSGDEERRKTHVGTADRSPVNKSQRTISTILETNASSSSSSSRSGSSQSLKSLTIDDIQSLEVIVTNQNKSLEEDSLPKALARSKMTTSDEDDYVEPLMPPVPFSSCNENASCSSQSHTPKRTSDETTPTQLDYACLAVSNVESSRKTSANTIQSGILQVAQPKFTYDYTVVDTQQP